MHPNAAFRPSDPDFAAVLVREIGFAAIFAATPDGPRVANVPLLLNDDRSVLRFHLARGNALTRHLDGAVALAVVQGPNAYVSPGDYGDAANVPTWNYIAVELEGTVRKTDRAELIAIIDDLSALHETRIAASPPWTSGKMAPAQLGRMVDTIVGFEMTITAWRPTAKLSQNKSPEQAARIIAALDQRGHSALARLMGHLGRKPKENR